MSQIKYVSVHVRDDGKRRIKAGKGEKEHGTARLPMPENDLEDWETHDWERLAVFDLPEWMPKSDFTSWWNENLDSEDEPLAIDGVLRLMGERCEEEE